VARSEKQTARHDGQLNEIFEEEVEGLEVDEELNKDDMAENGDGADNDTAVPHSSI